MLQKRVGFWVAARQETKRLQNFTKFSVNSLLLFLDTSCKMLGSISTSVPIPNVLMLNKPIWEKNEKEHYL